MVVAMVVVSMSWRSTRCPTPSRRSR